MRKRTEVDLTLIDNGKPHWLSPQGRRPDIAERIREKYRRRAKAEREVKKVGRLVERTAEIVKARQLLAIRRRRVRPSLALKYFCFLADSRHWPC
jgi:hypothetical protein